MKKKDKSMCIGCNDNFYNGNNPYGIKECWGFKKAKVMKRKKVGIWDVPPWKHTPGEYLSCYRQKGYIFVGANQEH